MIIRWIIEGFLIWFLIGFAAVALCAAFNQAATIFFYFWERHDG